MRLGWETEVGQFTASVGFPVTGREGVGSNEDEQRSFEIPEMRRSECLRELCGFPLICGCGQGWRVVVVAVIHAAGALFGVESFLPNVISPVQDGCSKRVFSLRGVGGSEVVSLLWSSLLQSPLLFTYVCVPQACRVLVEVRRRCQIPGTGVVGSRGPPFGCWESSLGPV